VQLALNFVLLTSFFSLCFVVSLSSPSVFYIIVVLAVHFTHLFEVLNIYSAHLYSWALQGSCAVREGVVNWEKNGSV
jgi:hypothetical protein